MSSSGEAVIRFFVGSYWQNRTSAADPADAIQEFQASLTDTSTSSLNTLILFPLTTEQIQSGSFPGATTTTYLVRDQDDSVFVDCTVGAKAVQLPTAKGKGGQKHLVKKVDAVNANLCTITFFGAETADARSSIVLSFLNQSVEFESDGTNWRITSFYAANQVLVSAPASKVFTATDRYPTMNGNSITLTPGTWRLFGDVYFGNNGLTPTYTVCAVFWAAANGADTNVSPAALSTLASTTVLTTSVQFMGAGTNASNNDIAAPETIITVTATGTVYLVCYGTMTTAARTLAYAYANAERIGP